MLTGILSVTIIGLCYCIKKAPEPVENRLHHDLLHVRSYSKLIRPVDSNLQRLTVKVGLRLSQLLDMVSHCQT